MSETTIKWILFGLMGATVPVLYFMFVIGGFLPLIAIVAMSFTGTWGFALFNAIHVLIYGAAFYWIARVVSKKARYAASEVESPGFRHRIHGAGRYFLPAALWRWPSRIPTG